MANTTTYIHLHTNINKNKNNDDYTNNHCIEILFLVSFSRIERLHWIFVTINLCVVLVCLRFALQYSKLAWNGYTKARRVHSFLAHICIMKSMEQKKIAFYEIKKKMDWTQKANDKEQQHAYRFIDTPKNIHRIHFYTTLCYHLLSLNVLYFSLYIDFCVQICLFIACCSLQRLLNGFCYFSLNQITFQA